MTTCAWCTTRYASHQPNCDNCGGPLPPPPGEDAGPEPPPPPRELPEPFVRRIRFGKNVPFIIGSAFLAAGLLFGVPFIAGGALTGQAVFAVAGAAALLIFGGIGGLLASSGWARAQATLRAFRLGQAAPGQITGVFIDRSVSINGRSPWAIEYSFPVGNRIHEGKAQTWDDTAVARRPGQPLHVLYVEQDPAQNTLYPPVK